MNFSQCLSLAVVLTFGSAPLQEAQPSESVPPPSRGILIECEGGISRLLSSTSKPERVLSFEGGGRRGLSWAPVEGRFAYASNHEDAWRLYLGNVDGTTKRLGDFHEDYILQVKWAALGQWIAYESQGRGVGTGGVSIVHSESGERKQLTLKGSHDGEFAWLPDGKTLVVAATTRSQVEHAHDVIWVDRDSAIELIDIESGKRTRIAALETQAFALSVSPDGSKILYIADSELWSVPAMEGSVPKRVLSDVANHVTPRFSRDGKAIFAVSRRRIEGSTYQSEDVPFILFEDGKRVEFKARSLTSEARWRVDDKEIAVTDSKGLHFLSFDGSERTCEMEDYKFQSALDWR